MLRARLVLGLSLALVCCSSAGPSREQPRGEPVAEDATETNAQPAPCTVDTDCGERGTCIHFEGTAGPGFCDVEEHRNAGEKD